MFKNTVLVAAIFAIAAICLLPLNSPAKAPQAQQQEQAQAANAWQYAQLTRTSNNQYQFDEGFERVPQTRSLVDLQRRLGNRNRPSFVNLMNSIGANGWELASPADSNSTTWLFKRRVN